MSDCTIASQSNSCNNITTGIILFAELVSLAKELQHNTHCSGVLIQKGKYCCNSYTIHCSSMHNMESNNELTAAALINETTLVYRSWILFPLVVRICS